MSYYIQVLRNLVVVMAIRGFGIIDRRVRKGCRVNTHNQGYLLCNFNKLHFLKGGIPLRVKYLVNCEEKTTSL